MMISAISSCSGPSSGPLSSMVTSRKHMAMLAANQMAGHWSFLGCEAEPWENAIIGVAEQAIPTTAAVTHEATIDWAFPI